MTEKKYYSLVCRNPRSKSYRRMVDGKVERVRFKENCGWTYRRYVCLQCFAEPEDQCPTCHFIKVHRATRRSADCLAWYRGIEYIPKGKTAYGKKKTMVCWFCGVEISGLSTIQFHAYLKASLKNWSTEDLMSVMRIGKRQAERLKKPKINHCPSCGERLVPTPLEMRFIVLRSRGWSLQRIVEQFGEDENKKPLTRYKVRITLDRYKPLLPIFGPTPCF